MFLVHTIPTKNLNKNKILFSQKVYSNFSQKNMLLFIHFFLVNKLFNERVFHLLFSRNGGSVVGMLVNITHTRLFLIILEGEYK